MRIVVTGKDGQVVTALKAMAAAADVDIIPLGRPEADLARPETLQGPIRAARPDIIISAAAYTAVDKAESEPDMAMAVNSGGPAELARLAAQLNIPILHLSTDYVFDGAKTEPYVETDPTGPASVYGATKLAGEQAIVAGTPNHVILRTAWVYSPYGNNFVKTMLRLGETRNSLNVVADQYGCPTYALEIARALIEVAKRLASDPDPALRGTFHLAAQGEASWAEFAKAIFTGAEARRRKPVGVNAIPTTEYPTPAKRPANSRLNGEKLRVVYGIELEPWQKSLDQCLDLLLGARSHNRVTQG